MTTELHHHLDDGRVKRDCRKKLQRLRDAHARLLPDSDHGFVLSELSMIESEITAAEAELASMEGA